MSKQLSIWITKLGEQFSQSELGKEVMRAKLTIGLMDLKSGEIQYHTVEYTAKEYKLHDLVRRNEHVE